jgi:hypothetical protein
VGFLSHARQNMPPIGTQPFFAIYFLIHSSLPTPSLGSLESELLTALRK